MPSGVKAHEEHTRAKLVLAINASSGQVDQDITSGKWLVDYLK